MIIHNIFEKRQTIINYTVKELLEMLSDDRLVLREINKYQVRMIRKYIFDNVQTESIYLPPIVAMLVEGKLDEGKPSELTIIDGTQRLKALSGMQAISMKAIDGEDKEEVATGFRILYALEKVELAVQIFEGLSTIEADQMFIDLNTKGKKVALSKRIAYDSRNAINQTTNLVLTGNKKLMEAGVEEEKRSVMRPKNKKLMSLSQLRQLVAIFITGKPVSSKGSFEKVSLTEKDDIQLINVWFDELFKLYPVRSIGNYDVSMLASFPLLLAMVQYVLVETEDLSFVDKKERVIVRMRRLKSVDWSRDLAVWREFSGSERGREKYFYLDNRKKNINALVEWMRIKGGE